jgi:hypothetical protein
VFYCLTKKGAKYIGRADEYKYKKYQRSPNNVMHESMKFDVALSFLRLFPHQQIYLSVRQQFLWSPAGYFNYELKAIESKSLNSIYIRSRSNEKKQLIEYFNEKIKRYEAMFKSIRKE